METLVMVIGIVSILIALSSVLLSLLILSACVYIRYTTMISLDRVSSLMERVNGGVSLSGIGGNVGISGDLVGRDKKTL